MKQGRQFASVGLLALLGSVALGALSGCSGKGAEGTCPAAAECGGDPTGTWSVKSACSFPVDAPYQQPNLVEFVQNPLSPSIAPEQTQPTTAGDWCSNLIYLPKDTNNPTGKVTAVNLWHAAPTLGSGSVTFDPAGSYAVTLNFGRNDQTHFAPSCLHANGAAQSCDELATNLSTFYVASATAKQEQGAPMSLPGFDQISCKLASDAGCDCVYQYGVVLSDSGTWAHSGSKILEASDRYFYNGQRVVSQAPTQPMTASYCRSGNQLTLTGDEGSSLSLAVGLRTLTLGM
jgi:hypothetical protein